MDSQKGAWLEWAHQWIKSAEGLDSCIEKGEAYLEDLGSMIRLNNIDEYVASINNRQWQKTSAYSL